MKKNPYIPSTLKTLASVPSTSIMGDLAKICVYVKQNEKKAFEIIFLR